jgi:hypothetical protein
LSHSASSSCHIFETPDPPPLRQTFVGLATAGAECIWGLHFHFPCQLSCTSIHFILQRTTFQIWAG